LPSQEWGDGKLHKIVYFLKIILEMMTGSVFLFDIMLLCMPYKVRKKNMSYGELVGTRKE